MDEPTSALTEREVRTLFTVIHKLQERGIAFLFVSHKLNEVLGHLRDHDRHAQRAHRQRG